MRLWIVRATWVTLPVTAGPALSSGLRAWGGAPRVLGAVLCWAAWGIGALAVLSPRPAGLTFLRAAGPAAVAAAVAVALSGEASTFATVGALAGSLLAAVLVADPAFAAVTANGVAYGDERRFPLRVPPALFLGILPAARVVAVGGAIAGPLLLADGDVAWGVAALVIGVPLSALAVRALHGLSRRWLVLVPAGVVVVDRMALADNVLFPREHVQLLRSFRADEAPGDALDLRVGATFGSMLLVFDEPAELVRAVRARRGGDTVRAPALVVAVAGRSTVLTEAARRRVRVEVAAPSQGGGRGRSG